MRKKILTFLLACVLVMGIIVGPLGMETVQAEYTKVSGDWMYKEMDDGTIDIAGYTGKKKAVKVPEKINGKKVTRISLFGNGFVTSVEIPDGVTSIGESAFEGCRLTSMEIPDSVTSIGDYAFGGCTDLTSIKLSNSLTSIEANVFLDCRSLTSIVIPDSVTSIGMWAFTRCRNMTSIVIPDSVTTIREWAFLDCGNLTDIYYGGSQEQWNQNPAWLEEVTNSMIYSDVNDYLGIEKWQKVVIHYNSEGPDEQTITVKNNITKTYGDKPFSLNARVNTGTSLNYAVSDKKVATVDKKGEVTIKGCGITNITITAPGTDAYIQAKKTIKLTVKPKKVTLSSVKSTREKTATLKWKQDRKAAGYLIQCATDSKFKKNKVQVTVSKNKTVSATVKKLKAGKKYYVRVCAYAKSGKTKVQGDWSKAKIVKVKK